MTLESHCTQFFALIRTQPFYLARLFPIIPRRITTDPAALPKRCHTGLIYFNAVSRHCATYAEHVGVSRCSASTARHCLFLALPPLLQTSHLTRLSTRALVAIATISLSLFLTVFVVSNGAFRFHTRHCRVDLDTHFRRSFGILSNNTPRHPYRIQPGCYLFKKRRATLSIYTLHTLLTFRRDHRRQAAIGVARVSDAPRGPPVLPRCAG